MSSDIDKFSKELGDELSDELREALSETPPTSIFFKCMDCRHFSGWYGDGFRCKAFPSGIPTKYIEGEELIHDEVVNGQVGKFIFTV